jgi:hypothetical protein
VNDRIQTGQLDTSKEEVLFNDSDIEDDSAVGEVGEADQESGKEALLSGTSQNDEVCNLQLMTAGISSSTHGCL